VQIDLDLSKRLLIDLSVAIAMLYAAVCIYEMANYVVFSSVGSQASLVFSGVLPIGVCASVQDAGLLMFAKPAQVALSTVAMLGLFFLTRSQGFRLSSLVALTTVSIYLASSYWELLSFVGLISYEGHLAIFSLLAIGAQLGLSRFFKA
jgi:hypothetical protein